MFGKDGTLICRSFLAWVRRQPCKVCTLEHRIGVRLTPARPGAEAHHFPPKGMGGAFIRDDRTIPLCRRHHDQAQRYDVGFSSDQQKLWVDETRSAFLEECSVDELREYFEALEVWKDRPLAVPF